MKYRKQISLGYNADGKRIRKWISADSKHELREKETELLLNAQEYMASTMLFIDYYDKWVATYKQHLAPSTLYRYTSYIRGKTEPLHNKALKDIKRTHVQEVVNGLWGNPPTCRVVYTAIKQVMKAAAADGLIVYRDYSLRMPKYTPSERRTLTSREKSVICAAENLNEREKAFLWLSVFLGLRPEETRALMRSDFDFTTGTVTICRAVSYSAGSTAATVKGTKTGSERTLPLPEALTALVKAYLRKKPGLFLFPGKNGAMERHEWQKLARDILSKLNIALGGSTKLNVLNGMNFYTFRHTRATELYYTRGISTKLAAYYMGHSELEFIRTYSHLDSEKEAIEELRRLAVE